MLKINTLAYFVSMSVTKKSGVTVIRLMLKQHKLEGLCFVSLVHGGITKDKHSSLFCFNVSEEAYLVKL
jgi:hypothetical protein